MAEWLCGRLTEAERALASSVTEWCEDRRAHADRLGLVASSVLIQLAQGPWMRPCWTCRAGPGQPWSRPAGRPPAAGPSYAVLADIAYQRDELDSALRHATEGIALCRQFLHPPAGQWPGHPGDGSGRPRRSGRGAGGDPPRPSRLHRARRGPLTRSPPGGPGCCWPRVTWPQRPVSRKRTASARTMSQTMPASPGTWCWPGSCSPRTGPAGAGPAVPAARRGGRPGPYR